MHRQVWFITGASKGFDMELTRAALARGHAVEATARNPKTIEAVFTPSEKLLTLPLDVTNEQFIRLTS